jgi:predicted transcriptional regulator
MGEHAPSGLALRPLVTGDILSPTMNVVTRAVRHALAGAPVSLREIGRRAGVSHAQLARIVAGERNATPAVARAVADALDAIGAECVTGAAQVRRSLTSHRGRK